jgi:hypothetical protein
VDKPKDNDGPYWFRALSASFHLSTQRHHLHPCEQTSARKQRRYAVKEAFHTRCQAWKGRRPWCHKVVTPFERKVKKLGSQHRSEGVHAFDDPSIRFRVRVESSFSGAHRRTIVSWSCSQMSDWLCSNETSQQTQAPVLQNPSLENTSSVRTKSGQTSSSLPPSSHLKNPVTGDVLHSARAVPSTFTGLLIDILRWTITLESSELNHSGSHKVRLGLV